MTPTIAALLREREHYIRRGLPDKAAYVTAELVRLGHETPESKAHESAPAPETTSLMPPPETATPPRPQPRRMNPNA